MNKFFQDDEQDLVTFLRQHRPLPPNNNPYLQQQVMNLIEQTSPKESKEHYLPYIKTISFLYKVLVYIYIYAFLKMWDQSSFIVL